MESVVLFNKCCSVTLSFRQRVTSPGFNQKLSLIRRLMVTERSQTGQLIRWEQATMEDVSSRTTITFLGRAADDGPCKQTITAALPHCVSYCCLYNIYCDSMIDDKEVGGRYGLVACPSRCDGGLYALYIHTPDLDHRSRNTLSESIALIPSGVREFGAGVFTMVTLSTSEERTVALWRTSKLHHLDLFSKYLYRERK